MAAAEFDGANNVDIGTEALFCRLSLPVIRSGAPRCGPGRSESEHPRIVKESVVERPVGDLERICR